MQREITNEFNYTRPVVIERSEVNGTQDTVSRLFTHAWIFQRDAIPFKKCDLWQMLRMLKRLPYVPDLTDKTTGAPIETFSRPAFVFDPQWTGPRDCDDKVSALLAWSFHRWVTRGIAPAIAARVIRATGARAEHHIYSEVRQNQRWVPADVTFPDRGEFGKTLYDEAQWTRYIPELPQRNSPAFARCVAMIARD